MPHYPPFSQNSSTDPLFSGDSRGRIRFIRGKRTYRQERALAVLFPDIVAFKKSATTYRKSLTEPTGPHVKRWRFQKLLLQRKGGF